MHDHDYVDFCALLDGVSATLNKGHKPDAQVSAIWFRTLVAYSIDLVRTGFAGHLRDPDRGRFAPTPADIIAKIHAHDGRVSADEAWAIAVKASDESATVTWNDEIAEAWGAALPVWQQRDKIGARMAFKDAYARIVERAKRSGARVQWWPTLGHDADGRLPEVKRAANAGLIGHDVPLALEMSGQASMPRDHVPPQIREVLMKLREKFTTKGPHEPEVKAELPPLHASLEDVHGARGPDLLTLGVVGMKRREVTP